MTISQIIPQTSTFIVPELSNRLASYGVTPLKKVSRHHKLLRHADTPIAEILFSMELLDMTQCVVFLNTTNTPLLTIHDHTLVVPAPMSGKSRHCTVDTPQYHDQVISNSETSQSSLQIKNQILEPTLKTSSQHSNPEIHSLSFPNTLDKFEY